MMNGRNEKNSSLGEEELVERIKKAYAPAKLAPARRVALEKDLWARIERRHWASGWLQPLLALVTVAAAVLWFARPVEPPNVVRLAAMTPDAWEYELLFADAAFEDSPSETDASAAAEGYAGIEILLTASE